MKKPAVFFIVWLLISAPPAGASEELKITIATSEEDIRVALDIIAEQSGYNIVIPEDIDLKIRVRLNNVTLLEALDSILVINNLRYVVQDKTILVYPEGNDNIVKALNPASPLKTYVLALQHVPVKSIKKTVEGLLSPRGKVMTIPHPRPQQWTKGDDFLPSSSNRSSARDKPGAEDDV